MPQEGWGAYLDRDGDMYEGQWLGGRKHGTGTMTFNSGSKYCYLFALIPDECWASQCRI